MILNTSTLHAYVLYMYSASCNIYIYILIKYTWLSYVCPTDVAFEAINHTATKNCSAIRQHTATKNCSAIRQHTATKECSVTNDECWLPCGTLLLGTPGCTPGVSQGHPECGLLSIAHAFTQLHWTWLISVQHTSLTSYILYNHHIHIYTVQIIGFGLCVHCIYYDNYKYKTCIYICKFNVYNCNYGSAASIEWPGLCIVLLCPSGDVCALWHAKVPRGTIVHK